MMPHALAQSIEIFTTILAVAAMGYFLAALIAARLFLAERRAPLPVFAPGVSILKSLKGLDPGMIDAFRSQRRQSYAGDYELLFGVSTLSDPAVTAVAQLQAEFSDRSIHLIECPQRLGTNGKVSTLVQLAAHARHDFLLINDSDITVSPHYLERVMASFAPTGTPSGAHQTTKNLNSDEVSKTEGGGIPDEDGNSEGGGGFNPRIMPTESRRALAPELRFSIGPQPGGDTSPQVGLVTALYRGRSHGTLPSLLESLGIATDFQAGVLLSKWIEGGLHYGLGSTLAVRREALEKIGGFQALVDHLADDYELGARVAAAGYRVALSPEVVETSVPPYTWRGYIDHQLRWARTVRDARPWGYAGLIFTHGLSWALLNLLASGLSPLSLWLLGLSFFLRLALAMTVGAEVLADHQVLPNLWLLPFRDLIAMGVWVAGFAGNTIVWRGDRFTLKGGKLHKVEPV
ncbi:MAG: glycosyltransferase [Terracidiphilus sp.]